VCMTWGLRIQKAVHVGPCGLLPVPAHCSTSEKHLLLSGLGLDLLSCYYRSAE
ncbi:UNVERIFIED_CONTAM: hypothetical protein K2H54_023048, partial [Gekko kuhli]